MLRLLAISVFSGSLWRIISSLSAFGAIIIIILLIMSLISWMIIFRKYRHFRAVWSDNTKFMHHFQRSRRLEEAAGQAKSYHNSTLARIYLAGLEEVRTLKEQRNEAGGLRDSVVPLTSEDFEIVEMAMERSLTEEIGKLEKQVIFLATTASSAPFMGLLGTVVGIMVSFWSIGERGSASLAVVAPGIAEALLATIVGLGAAIPAVIAYNWANNRIKSAYDKATGFVLGFISQARKEAM